MEITSLIFLSSGLLLGWSLGANDASNVFGTAVGTRMIRFRTAAILCGVFLVLGAVISGSGASEGLGELGKVDALPGAFTVALSAAFAVFLMTKSGLPVSTTQAIVGAIVGWNVFSGSKTDLGTLSRIVGTWVACPILGALAAAPLYALARLFVRHSRIHILRIDHYTRVGLILAGVLAAYSLGANNIANVMGVFVPSAPFTDAALPGGATFTASQQLFLIGSLAIAVGVATYSKRVMATIGSGILPLTPIGAWVVVMAQSLVLTLFSSKVLQSFLATRGLPTIPLIPVSSTQAVVGAVVGIGLAKGPKGLRLVRWRALRSIAVGWVTAPLVAGVVCFFALFFMKNVFDQQVHG